MSGHVFACRADLTRLACDAWLLPAGTDGRVQAYWDCEPLRRLGVLSGDLSGFACTPDFGAGQRAARPVRPEDLAGWPLPILTVTGDDRHEPVDWYVDALDAFLAAWLEAPVRLLAGRLRPLLAVPLVGTGGGGAADRVARIIVGLLERSRALATAHDVDIAIVVRDPFQYSVVQMERKRSETFGDFWPALSAEHKRRAGEIAAYVKARRLVLFLGAGVSAGAGLPGWNQLLAALADLAEFGDSQRAALADFNFLDQAEILGKHLSARGIDMNREIVRLLSDKPLYALSHALLSDWPCDETVTQNYDTMFEMACRDSGQPLSVIPYSFESDSRKWLLKMHGCVTAPEDIVLSRSDYLDYDYNRSALSGIVQALLVTKHMLFLGFSLTDDHFIQLIFGVHKAVEGMRKDAARPQFGTVLSPIEAPLQEQLWQHELNFVGSGLGAEDRAAAFHWHDVFLDHVTALVHTAHNYLFHHEYDPLLTPEETALRAALEAAHERVKALSDSDMVREFEDYLRSLGMDV